MQNEHDRQAQAGSEGIDRSGVKLIELPIHRDRRGSLTVAEFQNQIPFSPARVFFVADVPPGRERGGHAKINCDEVLVAVSGSLSVGVDYGSDERHITLDEPTKALYIPRMTYCWQYDFSAGAVLCVLSSQPYHATHYISSRAEFHKMLDGKDV